MDEYAAERQKSAGIASTGTALIGCALIGTPLVLALVMVVVGLLAFFGGYIG